MKNRQYSAPTMGLEVLSLNDLISESVGIGESSDYQA